MKVKILHPWLPSYRIAFFRELIRLGKTSGVEYEIYSGSAPRDSKNRADEVFATNFHRRLGSLKVTLFRREAIYYRTPDDWLKADLIIYEHALRNVNAFLDLFLFRRGNVALWGQGRTFTKKKNFIERFLQKKLVKQSCHYFAYTEQGVRDIAKITKTNLQITNVQNSSDSRHLRELILEAKLYARDNKEKLCKKEGKFICIFVGALDISKRIDFLIESADLVAAVVPNFELNIYGDGPLRSFVQARVSERKFLTYNGRAEENDLARISQTAKLILNPGRVGLIAVDSLTMGVPIVTTNFSFHAPEFEYLSHNRNCLVSNDNLSDYAENIISAIRNPDLIEFLSTNCLLDYKKYGIERMALNFHEGVLFALNQKNHLDI